MGAAKKIKKKIIKKGYAINLGSGGVSPFAGLTYTQVFNTWSVCPGFWPVFLGPNGMILRVFTTTGTGCSQGVHGCSRVFTTTSTVFANQYYVGFPRISPNDVGCSIATDTPLYNI